MRKYFSCFKRNYYSEVWSKFLQLLDKLNGIFGSQKMKSDQVEVPNEAGQSNQVEEPNKAGKSNHVEVPYAVVELLVNYIPNYADHLNFKAVCKLWNFVESENPALPAELPWLMLSSSDGNSKFYEICSRSFYVNPIPRIDHSAALYGTYSDGWLLCFTDNPKSIFLNNVYSGDKISLPSRTSLCLSPNPFEECAVPSCEWINMTRGVSLVKTTFSCSPSLEDCLIASINQHGCSITIMQPKSNNSHATTVHLGGEGLLDIIFCDNKIIGVDRSKTVYTFVIADNLIGLPQVTKCEKHKTQKFNSSQSTFSNRSANNAYNAYLVQVSDKLLMIVRHYGGSGNTSTSTVGFKVYELVWKSTLEWVEVQDLQGHVIFLDTYIRRVFHASQFPDMKGDQIYFTSSSELFDTGVFSMRDQKISNVIPPEHLSRHAKPVWLFPPNCGEVCFIFINSGENYIC
ncbi:hypothetical protein LUZ62_074002 [Rhynchospora pubera]|uniref:KIB1-4 beta-propeller domain-containing protein n=1 Tax=Rhynchospora pubera TaxID=906938 RepID=A0AAV8D5C2_9POAL|nr:hypothetical protein LUZ62_074002 [Rhynchospora pubera]